MKLTKRTRIKAAALIGAEVVLLGTLATTTFAWFVVERTGSGSVTQIGVVGDIDVTPTIIKYNVAENAAYDASEESDALHLNEYDAIITSRNKYTAIYIAVEISPYGNSGVLSCVVNATKGLLDDGTILSAISNVIQFKVALASDEGFDGLASYLETPDYDGFYSNAKTAFENSTAYTFVDYASASTYEDLTEENKNTTLDLFSNTSITLNGTDTVSVYIEIDYNTTLVEYYLDSTTISASGDSSSGNDVLSEVGGTSVEMDSDVASITFSTTDSSSDSE